MMLRHVPSPPIRGAGLIPRAGSSARARLENCLNGIAPLAPFTSLDRLHQPRAAAKAGLTATVVIAASRRNCTSCVPGSRDVEVGKNMPTSLDGWLTLHCRYTHLLRKVVSRLVLRERVEIVANDIGLFEFRCLSKDQHTRLAAGGVNWCSRREGATYHIVAVRRAAQSRCSHQRQPLRRVGSQRPCNDGPISRNGTMVHEQVHVQ